eukprot:c9763_g1_i1.p3 GENE.c9763_g1_i1~~c9763_g1_i1.p3  ORF type:complete len:121 (+),score=35.30 c9763_g1_i1:642-1004(+)
MAKSMRSKIKRKFRAIARSKQELLDIAKTKAMHEKLMADIRRMEKEKATGVTLAASAEAMDADSDEGAAADEEGAAMAVDEKSNRYYKQLRESKSGRRKRAAHQARNAPKLRLAKVSTKR